MTGAPLSTDDTARLIALHASHPQGATAKEYFDSLTAMGARLFDLPICLLSLGDSGRQRFKSCHGMSERQTASAHAFSTHMVTAGTSLVVADTRQDLRFAANALVRQPPHIRAYAGRLLRGRDDSVLGTLCVMDTKPRRFSVAELVQLADLALLAEEHIVARHVSDAQAHLVKKLQVARREALLDPMLRIWNHGGLRELLRLQEGLSRQACRPFSVCMIDVDRFKAVNDRYGHPAGDEVLRRITQALQAALRPGDALGRYGGEEFLVLLPDANVLQAHRVGMRLMDAVTAQAIPVGATTLSCTISVGVAEWSPREQEPLDALVARADEALLTAKRLGRQRVEMSPARRTG